MSQVRKEFLQLKQSILKTQFKPKESHPLKFGIERIAFERRQLNRLIAAAKEVDTLQLRKQVEIWERKLARLQDVEDRLERLNKEISTNQIVVDNKPAPSGAFRRYRVIE